MADRSNHYEAAFEDYLRRLQVPYVAVDESRRSLMGGTSIKNLDFIVSPAGATTWLVDVKGRMFGKSRYWKNWSTRDDLSGLARWEQLFGSAFESLFVFAYHVVGERAPLPAEELHEFRSARYGFLGIRLRDYIAHVRLISPKWNTVEMPARLFRQYAEPVERFLAPPDEQRKLAPSDQQRHGPSHWRERAAG